MLDTLCVYISTLGLCTGRVAHRGKEVWLYSYMTAALEGVRGQRHALAALYLRERPGTYCTGS